MLGPRKHTQSQTHEKRHTFRPTLAYARKRENNQSIVNTCSAVYTRTYTGTHTQIYTWTHPYARARTHTRAL